jgi:hypothetical protein
MGLAALLSDSYASPQRVPGCDTRNDGAPAHQASVPDTIVGTPAGKLLRWPSLACVNDTVYIVANAFPTDVTADIGRRAMVIARVPGQPLPLPEGDFAFAYPRLLRRRGGLDLFWAEFPTAASTPREWLGKVTAIWHAEFIRGKWTRPELILRAYAINWAEQQSAIVAADDNARIHIVVPAALTGGATKLTHVAGVTGDWSTQDLAVVATYTSIVVMSTNKLVVAYAAPDGPGDHGSMFITKSSDDGAHWSPGILVGPTPGKTAFAPELIRSGDVTHLLWSSGPGSMRLDRMWYSRSDDAGRTWLKPTEAMLREGSRTFEAVGTPCGDVVAFVQRFDGRELHLSQLTWTSGRSNVDSVLFADRRLTAFPGALQTASGIDVVYSEMSSGEHGARSVIAREPVCQKATATARRR